MRQENNMIVIIVIIISIISMITIVIIIDFIIMSGTYLPYQLLGSKIEQGLIAVLSIKEGRHHRIKGKKKL